MGALADAWDKLKNLRAKAAAEPHQAARRKLELDADAAGEEVTKHREAAARDDADRAAEQEIENEGPKGAPVKEVFRIVDVPAHVPGSRGKSGGTDKGSLG